MQIRTLDFTSGRTRDGRQFTALEGATLEVDDSDQDMVDLFRSFVGQGVAVLLDEEPAGESEPQRGGEPETEQTTQPQQTEQPKKTTTAAKKSGRSA